MHECESCDYRHWPARCYSSATGHARLCELIHDLDREDYRRVVARKMTGLPEPPCQAAPDPRGAQARSTMAELQQIKRCPHRTAPECGCPDSPAKCARQDKPSEVYPVDCLACLDEPIPTESGVIG